MECMQLFEIKTDTFHTAILSRYLNQSNTFQSLKHTASELDCANCDFGVLPISNNLHRCSACAIRIFVVVFCVNATENKSTCCSLAPLYTDVREKLLDDTSQNAVTASLESVLSWKYKTSLFRLANSVFSAARKKEEFTGSD